MKTLLLGSPARENPSDMVAQGDRIVFSSVPGARLPRSVHIVDADGREDPVPVLESTGFNDYVTDWSADGNTLVVTRANVADKNNFDLWYLQRKEGGGWQETPFLQTKHAELHAKLSPDGRFIAYGSYETGEREIYVRSFPDGKSFRRVSANGGAQAQWRRDGKELFFVEGNSLMAVPVTTTPSLTVGTAKKLFSHDSLPSRVGNTYDVAPNGQRFILCETEAVASDAKIRVVLNWLGEFEGRE